MRRKFQQLRRAALVAAIVLSVGSTMAGDAENEEGVRDSAAQDAVIHTASGGMNQSAEQVATEILRLRQLVGAAWVSDAIADPSESTADENEVIRTALVTQASAASSGKEWNSYPTPSNQTTALRDAAYQLDLTAHALECQELYERADQLRAVAQELREQARGERRSVQLQGYGHLFRPAHKNR